MTNEKRIRDDKLIFVGMPTATGQLEPTTAECWKMFDRPFGGYTFIKRKVQCYSAAKARNIITGLAYTTAASKLLLIDADMNWSEDHVLRILSHQVLVVGGIYPRKELVLWQKWVGKFLGDGHANSAGLSEMREIGAGFLCLDLDAVTTLITAHPELKYLSDDDTNRGDTLFNLWGEFVASADWDDDGQVWPRYLTEDFAICYRLRQLGIPVWGDNICQIGHIGRVDFLQVMAVIQELSRGTKVTEHGASAPTVPLHT